MTRLFEFGIVGVVLLAAASQAMAQDSRIRPGTFDRDGYGANGSMQTGPYSPPRPALRQAPSPKVLPFTWEEKRHFDQSNAEQS